MLYDLYILVLRSTIKKKKNSANEHSKKYLSTTT